MADAWPEDLPQCFIRGYSEGVADGLVEVKVDQGPPIRRRRTSSAARPLSGQMRLTRAQIATLRTFFDTTLIGGSLPFDFPDPTVTGETLLVMFEKGLPRWQETAGGVYLATIALVVLP